MAKGGREKIKLESSAGTGHFYTTSKNKRKIYFQQIKNPLRAGFLLPRNSSSVQLRVAAQS